MAIRANFRRADSGQLYWPVVIAMIAVGMMQPRVHQVIDVIAMRYRFVPAGWPMDVTRALDLRRAVHRVGGTDPNDMFVDMISMRVVQMTVMEIVNVAIMANRRVSAVRAMLMGMVGMSLLGTGGHGVSFWFGIQLRKLRSFPFARVLDGALHQLQNVLIGQGIKHVLRLSPSFHQPHGV
jgi:hypothetical protein